MICYKDRTFCATPHEKCTCSEYRKLTPEILEAAQQWWVKCGGTHGEAPIAISVFCDPEEPKENVLSFTEMKEKLGSD